MRFTQHINLLVLLYGAGVAIADFNKDGLEDILFTANETAANCI
ncbi:MAG: FG-GAP repeat protein [Saprospiraceae bacterium]|nr:FG-GAP repeat protein [Saprospiraceae bacterium]